MTVNEIVKLIDLYATLRIRDVDTDEALYSCYLGQEDFDTEYANRAVVKMKVLSHALVLYVKK